MRFSMVGVGSVRIAKAGRAGQVAARYPRRSGREKIGAQRRRARRWMLATQIQDVRHGIVFLGKVANCRRWIVFFRAGRRFRQHGTEDLVDIARGRRAVSAAGAYSCVTAPLHLVAVLCHQLDAIVVVLAVLTRPVLRYDRAVSKIPTFSFF